MSLLYPRFDIYGALNESKLVFKASFFFPKVIPKSTQMIHCILM